LLAKFLSEPRVVEIPRLVWPIILYGLTLCIRPVKSAKLYQSIWTDKGSPLKVIAEQQKEKLTLKLAEKYGDNVVVDLAIRYGQPRISSALKGFQ